MRGFFEIQDSARLSNFWHLFSSFIQSFLAYPSSCYYAPNLFYIKKSVNIEAKRCQEVISENGGCEERFYIINVYPKILFMDISSDIPDI